eukprot:1813878-Alexandrium_andersonii.AAC.1
MRCEAMRGGGPGPPNPQKPTDRRPDAWAHARMRGRASVRPLRGDPSNHHHHHLPPVSYTHLRAHET